MAKEMKAADGGIVGADQYMRYTDKEGKSHVEHHRVIAGGRFAQNQIDAAKIGGKSKAEVIDEATYRAERKR